MGSQVRENVSFYWLVCLTKGICLTQGVIYEIYFDILAMAGNNGNAIWFKK